MSVSGVSEYLHEFNSLPLVQREQDLHELSKLLRRDYIHRVGRTARAGRSGRAITFVTQYDVELYQRIEQLIGKRLPKFDVVEEEVMMLVERVTEAQRLAKMEMRESQEKKKRPRQDDDEAHEVRLPSKSKTISNKKKKKRR